MALSPNLNRRHEAGIFLALLAVGLSLFLEASAKQTAGVALFGIAFAWLFGSVSLRVLWLSLFLLVCAVGLALAGFPLWQDWSLYEAQAQDYDSVMSGIQAAVVAEVSQEQLTLPPGMVLAHNCVPPDPKVLPPGFFGEPAKQANTPRDRVVKIPGGAPPDYDMLASLVRWIRPEHWDISANTCVEFPGSMSVEGIVNAFRVHFLLPRPKFLLAAAIVTHTTPFFSGIVLVAAGLGGLGVVLWRARREKHLVDASPSRLA